MCHDDSRCITSLTKGFTFSRKSSVQVCPPKCVRCKQKSRIQRLATGQQHIPSDAQDRPHTRTDPRSVCGRARWTFTNKQRSLEHTGPGAGPHSLSVCSGRAAAKPSTCPLRRSRRPASARTWLRRFIAEQRCCWSGVAVSWELPAEKGKPKHLRSAFLAC